MQKHSGYNIKTSQLLVRFNLLQARLELALSYSPNRILSPTRLPIPPLEHGYLIFILSSVIGRLAYLPLSKTIINCFLGRVPLKHGFRYCDVGRRVYLSSQKRLSIVFRQSATGARFLSVRLIYQKIF